MLEYYLTRNGKEVDEGTIGNQFKFLALIDALRGVYEKLPNKYPTVYKYFPTSNDGEIPVEKLEQFLKEFKAIGKEKIRGNELVWENSEKRQFLLSDALDFTQMTQTLYQVINEDGYNLVMEKSAFIKESNSKDRVTLSMPYKEKGTNWNAFSRVNLEDPIIVFQSKSFIIRSLENLHLYIDKEDEKRRFLCYFKKDFGIIERVNFGQAEINFEDFNYIYSKLLGAITEAYTQACTIKWG